VRRRGGVTQHGVMAGARALERITPVPPQLEAVRALDGVGRPLAGTFGVRTAAVAADERHARRRAEPGGDGGRLTVRQAVDARVALQVEHDRAVALAAPE